MEFENGKKIELSSAAAERAVLVGLITHQQNEAKVNE